MKRTIVSILALSVLVGGAVLASAKSDKVIVASTSDIAITNALPLLWVDVSELPSSPFVSNGLSSASIVFVNTDDSGKIQGVVNFIKDWTTANGSNAPTILAQSSLFGSVKGKVSASKMGQPTTQITVKANGYTAPTTNLLVINNQPAGAGLSTLNINFSSKNPAVPLNTNNLSNAAIAGTSKIQFKSGIAAVNPSTKSFTEVAVLPVFQNIVSELDFRVVQYGSKLGVIGGSGALEGAGEGSVNSKNAYSVNLKGLSGSSSLQIKGQVAALSYITPGATNSITTINTATEKGKVQGQAINGQGYWARFLSF